MFVDDPYGAMPVELGLERLYLEVNNGRFLANPSMIEQHDLVGSLGYVVTDMAVRKRAMLDAAAAAAAVCVAPKKVTGTYSDCGRIEVRWGTAVHRNS